MGIMLFFFNINSDPPSFLPSCLQGLGQPRTCVHQSGLVPNWAHAQRCLIPNFTWVLPKFWWFPVSQRTFNSKIRNQTESWINILPKSFYGNTISFAVFLQLIVKVDKTVNLKQLSLRFGEWKRGQNLRKWSLLGVNLTVPWLSWVAQVPILIGWNLWSEIRIKILGITWSFQLQNVVRVPLHTGAQGITVKSSQNWVRPHLICDRYAAYSK